MNTNRYIRQTSLKSFGVESQKKLKNAKVLVVGIGGLGIPVLQYLNAMGVGILGLVEQDTVEITNLQRQVLYTENDIGKQKIEVALEKLKAQNSNTTFEIFDTFLTKENALEIIAYFDVIVDASDNFATRYLVNDSCIILNKPFIYGALHEFEGQVSVFNYKGGPTYRCLFPEMPSNEEIPNCNDNGVLGVIPGIIGNLQALETVKVITGIGEVITGKLLIYNGLNQSILKINFKTNPENLNITNLQETYEVDACEVVNEIEMNDFIKLASANKDLQLIDVRNEDEFSEFSLSNSINIPLGTLEANINKISSEKSIYLVCQSGKRSKTAYHILSKILENPNLYNVSGGINKYMELCQ